MSRGLSSDPSIDQSAWKALNADTSEVLTTYQIAAEDVTGPYQKIPTEISEQAKLEHLGYQSPQEALGEKFHLSPDLLRALNPAASLAAGDNLLVPNVITEIPVRCGKLVVSKSKLIVSAYTSDDNLISQYPSTIGSAHDPLPIGNWKITGVGRNPKFHYNPKLFWDAASGDTKATVPPGPNNPVGVVWIDLSKPHYGIHGTPEPSRVGHSESHGCIRLTNWDALELADLVSPGIPALLEE